MEPPQINEQPQKRRKTDSESWCPITIDGYFVTGGAESLPLDGLTDRISNICEGSPFSVSSTSSGSALFDQGDLRLVDGEPTPDVPWLPPPHLDVDKELESCINVRARGSGDGAQQRTACRDENHLQQGISRLFPYVPSLEDRSINLSLENPFAESINKPRHPSLEKRRATRQAGVAVNGYIKVSEVHPDSVSRSTPAEPSGSRQRALSLEQYKEIHPDSPIARIPGLPPNFGRGVNLYVMDDKLLKFYLDIYCQSRTLLPKDNLWLKDIVPMMAESECVKHSLLALASLYVLDFSPEKQLQYLANCHYAAAARHLKQLLACVDAHSPGCEASVLASLVLLIADDIINWETRKPKHMKPHWLTGAQTARAILDRSHPGYKYSKPVNVQATAARVSLSNWIAFVNILVEPFVSLSPSSNGRLYPWLIHGSPHQTRRINGGTGTSPKLLHVLAQITYLSGNLNKRPENGVLLLSAKMFEKELEQMHQWSDLSQRGYHTYEFETLMEDCRRWLDADTGKVNSPAFVTDLTAQAWIATAQVYLQCRLFRKPRSHRHVLDPLDRLTRCIRLLPVRGRLFTAQAPLFPVFMMSLVSFPDSRQTAREWFEAVCATTSGRSSVPPIWSSLQRIWNWMDGVEDGGLPLLESDPEEEGEEGWDISSKLPWWEKMVDWIWDNEGYLSLV